MAGRMSIEGEIIAQLAGSVEVEHALDHFAEKVRDYARDLAPVFDPDRDKRSTPGIGDEAGEFRDSIEVSGIKAPGHRRVGSNSPIALWQEIGTRHFPEMAIFAKTAKYFGGTGPDFESGVAHAQSHLRGELEKLEKLVATGAAARQIAAARSSVEHARMQRSAAFKAARGGRRGRR